MSALFTVAVFTAQITPTFYKKNYGKCFLKADSVFIIEKKLFEIHYLLTKDSMMI
jgi:hypothetical protein